MSKSRRNSLKALVILAASGAVASTAMGQGYAGPVLSPTALDFGNVAVGSTSAVQTITVSIPNTDGTPALSIVSIVLPNGFVRSGGTCPASGAATVPCTIGVASAPTSAGPQSGNMVVTGSVFGAPAVASNAALMAVAIPVAAPAVSAPSLSNWGLGLLLATLMASGVFFARKR